MPALLITARQPLSGKTTVAVGLAQRLHQAGRKVALLRLAGDEGADADAQLFTSFSFNAYRGREGLDAAAAAEATKAADFALVEAPAGDPSEALRALPTRAIVVARYPQLTDEQLSILCRRLGDTLLGLIATFVPRRRLESARQSLNAAGLPALALVPEDRTLASPTLGDVVAALEARTMFVDGHELDVLDRVCISSISTDPGQGYFARLNPNAVIVRSDKPDLQLAALNAGGPCLVITGGLAVLSYVLQRAEENEIPLLLTNLDTIAVVQRLENLYGGTRFAGAAKIQRINQLLSEALDPEGLAQALAK